MDWIQAFCLVGMRGQKALLCLRTQAAKTGRYRRSEVVVDEFAVLGRMFSLTLNLGRPGTILTNRRRQWKGMPGEAWEYCLLCSCCP